MEFWLQITKNLCIYQVGLLLDQAEFQQRVQTYIVHRGQTEHWMQLGPFQRPEYPQALGSHLAGKDRWGAFSVFSSVES